jgi:hypothetical protein
MAEIEKVETGYYRVPLPVTLSDSTHGDISAKSRKFSRITSAMEG